MHICLEYVILIRHLYAKSIVMDGLSCPKWKEMHVTTKYVIKKKRKKEDANHR